MVAVTEARVILCVTRQKGQGHRTFLRSPQVYKQLWQLRLYGQSSTGSCVTVYILFQWLH